MLQYKSIYLIFIIILKLNASEFELYEAINIDTNKSCQFYEESDYLTEKSLFTGACKNGFIDGNATIIHHNNHKYIGFFEKGYYSGYGKFIWDEENYIEGNFTKNQLIGLGKSYNYGNVSIGQFHKNLFTGYGTFNMKFGDKVTIQEGKEKLLQSAIYEEKAFWSKTTQSISLKFLNKSLNIREQYLKNHPLLIDTYDNLVNVLLQTKNTKSLKESKKYLLKALKIRERIYNKNSKTISTAYNNLAIILSDLGEFDQALEYGLKAIKIDEVTLSEYDPNLALLYSAVSLIYREISKLKESKKYLLKSLYIRKKILDTDSENLGIDYNLLSLIYQELGDLEQSKEYAIASLKITEKLFGENHPYVIKGYNNLAMIYLDLKEYTEGKKFTEKSLKLAEKIFDKDSYELSAIYNNSSLMYKEINQLKEAKKYGLKGLKIAEEVLSKNHPELGSTYANISLLFMKLGDYKEGKEYAYKALKIREVNQNFIALMMSYRDISFIYVKLKDYTQAFLYYSKSSKLFLKSREFLSQLSNRAKKNSLDRDSLYIYNLLDMSLLIQREETAQNVLNLWLQYKGEITNSQTYLMALQSRNKDTEIKLKIDELIEVKKDYANFYLKKVFAESSIKYDDNISRLKKRKGMLEEYLSNKIGEYKKSLRLKDINSSQISKRLGEDELYIDFAKTDNNYYIFTLDSNNTIEYKVLDKNGTEIDNMIDTFRENIIRFGEVAYDEDIPKIKKEKELEEIEKDSEILGREIYHLLFKDIDNKYKKFIISPDGQLNLLPFEALYTDRDNYLIEDRNISYISSGKALIKAYESHNNSIKSNQIIVFSNPSFDENITYTDKGYGKIRGVDNFFEEALESLDESKDAIFIKKIFEKREDIKIVSYTEANATKENLFDILNPPKVLHFSTHSLYEKDDNRDIEEPLMKSALALAGYNYNSEKNNFVGLLTALEFSNLNLYNTELVFLASCKSALGDIHSSEGVYGLNRASQLAGAKRVISAIWSVADRESAMMSEKFYTNIERGKGYVEALKISKLEMIEKQYHPFYWAGFIENGIDVKEENEKNSKN